MLCELVSKLPPSWGVVSSTTFDKPASASARPEIIVLRVSFLSPPPEVSIARNTSSFATVLISARSPKVVLSTSSILSSAAVAVTPSRILSSAAVEVTAVLLIDKASVSSVPSISTLPEISNEPASNSPEIVRFRIPV